MSDLEKAAEEETWGTIGGFDMVADRVLEEDGLGTGFIVSIIFNDMFAWGVSDVIDFKKGDPTTAHEAISELKKWYDEKGAIFFKEFDEVPYPSKDNGTYTSAHIQAYFDKNIEIAKRCEDSIAKWCGRNDLRSLSL